MFSRVLQGWVGPGRAGRAKAGLGGSEASWVGPKRRREPAGAATSARQTQVRPGRGRGRQRRPGARRPLWQVDLVAGDQRRTGRQVRVVGLQLGLQRRQVALGVAALLDRHEVENVHQHGGARQVAQEAVAEALALGGPRDQARNVGEHEVAAVHAHHPEHRLQRGEGVVGDLGAGGGGARHDARLAGVGEADQADVGEQPQLQPQAALLPGLAALVEVRDAPAGRQGGVAAPAAPAPGGHEAGAGGGEIGEQAAILVADHGADRHGQEAVGAVGALAVVALAVGALAGALVRVEVVLDQGRHAGVGRQYHVPAVTAVATVRPTPGPVLLTVERGDPVAPATCGHLESGLVYEHRPPAPRPGDGLLALLYAGELAAADLVVDDPAGDLGEQGVVAATADAGAGVDARAALAHQDRAGGDDLAAEPLHAQALGRGVTAVAAGRGAFLVGHLGSALLLLLSGLLARGAALGAKLDALDLEPGQELTVALVALLAGLVLVGVDQHLLAAVLGDHGGGHGRLREVVGGDGDLAPVLDHEQWLELEAGAVVTGEPLDVDDVPGGDLVLLPASADDGVHRSVVLSLLETSWGRQREAHRWHGAPNGQSRCATGRASTLYVVGDHHPTALAGRAGLGEAVQQPAGDPLAGHLHQAQRGDLHHLALGLVARQGGAQPLDHRVLVLLEQHVDEVDDDDPADVP